VELVQAPVDFLLFSFSRLSLPLALFLNGKKVLWNGVHLCGTSFLPTAKSASPFLAFLPSGEPEALVFLRKPGVAKSTCGLWFYRTKALPCSAGQAKPQGQRQKVLRPFFIFIFFFRK
jgi:hypothetical protein